MFQQFPDSEKCLLAPETAGSNVFVAANPEGKGNGPRFPKQFLAQKGCEVVISRLIWIVSCKYAGLR